MIKHNINVLDFIQNQYRYTQTELMAELEDELERTLTLYSKRGIKKNHQTTFEKSESPHYSFSNIPVRDGYDAVIVGQETLLKYYDDLNALALFNQQINKLRMKIEGVDCVMCEYQNIIEYLDHHLSGVDIKEKFNVRNVHQIRNHHNQSPYAGLCFLVLYIPSNHLDPNSIETLTEDYRFRTAFFWRIS